jgi:hypothetical protein
VWFGATSSAYLLSDVWGFACLWSA